jgi:hypothetical protein
MYHPDRITLKAFPDDKAVLDFVSILLDDVLSVPELQEMALMAIKDMRIAYAERLNTREPGIWQDEFDPLNPEAALPDDEAQGYDFCVAFGKRIAKRLAAPG